VPLLLCEDYLLELLKHLKLVVGELGKLKF
jgi:hypothetical protein